MIHNNRIHRDAVFDFIDLLCRHGMELPRLPRADTSSYNSVKTDSKLSRNQYLFLLDTFPDREPEQAFTDISFLLHRLSGSVKNNTSIRIPKDFDMRSADRTRVGQTEMRETLIFMPPGVTASQLRAAIALGNVTWGREDDEQF